MRHRWITIASLLTIAAWHHAACQSAGNMVFNPSFEEYTQCPERIEAKGIMAGVVAWWQPTAGSSDYFNACNTRECGMPRNKMGNQQAHEGKAYCGIYCSQENYREYLQSELKQPLKKGHRYRVGFWASLAEKSPHAVSSLGALLTRDRIEDTASWGILLDREVISTDDGQQQTIAYRYKPQVVNHPDSVMDDTKRWFHISGDFIAEGGERFITIGNFNSFNQSHVVSVDNANAILQGAYYYIDDVSLESIDNDDTIAPAPVVATPAKGDIVKLDGIYFASGRSDVLPQSYMELQRIKTMLVEHPTMTIELRGHTDNQGTFEFNRQLSEARARAVAQYLIEHGGIDSSRITYVGFGKSKPVDTNDTPEGRGHNRRVELRVLSD